MCGICGIISRHPVDPEVLRNMNRALGHRGPDGEGFHFGKTAHWSVGLGHRRLAIIDLSESGRQPMTNENGTAFLTANGEIYNYLELQRELKSLGHRFRSRSDSEVILHAYEEWGTDCVKRFKGMFAFAIWDSVNEQLFLARDLFGEKPLFYAQDAERLSFASELPALLKIPSIPRELDFGALLQYLYCQVIMSPHSIFKGIHKLSPGCAAIYKNGALNTMSYVSSLLQPLTGEQPEGLDRCEHLRNVLIRTVQAVLVSDVPVGVFLSGGLDSSLILAIIAQQTGRSLRTFSIGFNQNGFNELPWARKVAARFHTTHHEDVVDLNISGVLPEIVNRLGEPMADSSMIPYYHLSRLAASEVKVVLGGDGADEIWGGYRRHVLRPYLHLFSRLSPAISCASKLFSASDTYYAGSVLESLKLAEQLGLAQKNGYMPWNPLFSTDELVQLVDREAFKAFDAHPFDSLLRAQPPPDAAMSSVNQMLWIDQRTFLPEDILTKVDRMSMAHALEVRAPFLHPDVAALAFATPGYEKISLFAGKRILKKAARKFLPGEIINRRKHGFSVPLDAWFRKEGHSLFRETVLTGGLVNSGLLKKSFILEILQDHLHARSNYGRQLWSLLVLEMWCKSHLEK